MGYTDCVTADQHQGWKISVVIVNVSVRSRDNTLLMLYQASHVDRVEARLSVVLIEDLLPLDSKAS